MDEQRAGRQLHRYRSRIVELTQALESYQRVVRMAATMTTRQERAQAKEAAIALIASDPLWGESA